VNYQYFGEAYMTTFAQPRTAEELYAEYIEQRVFFFVGQSEFEGFVKDVYYCTDGVAFLLITNENHKVVVPWAKINYSIILPQGSSIISKQEEALATKRQRTMDMTVPPVVQVDPQKVRVK
jgi:hypothetical protein